MANIVLFEGMLLSQIKQRTFETTLNLDWQFSGDLLFYWLTSLKILRCWFHQRSKPTHTVFSLHRHCPSLSLILSLSVSLSPLLAVFPSMFYLSPLHLNTWLIWCLIMIDRNKLIWTTVLFHLWIAYNIPVRVCHWSDKWTTQQLCTVKLLKLLISYVL